MATKKEQFQELYGLFLKIKSKNDAELLLKDILTSDELSSISERLQIFKLLLKEVPHRKISKTLKVSISKVTRGSHALKKSKSVISKPTRKR